VRTPSVLPFLADPDVFILRSRKVDLNAGERYTLFLLNALFGRLLFTSDDVSRYTPEEERLFLSLFPFREKRFVSVRSVGGIVTAVFFIGENRYRVYANLADRPVRFVLPPATPRGGSPSNYFRDRTAEGASHPTFAGEGDPVDLAEHESACFLTLSDDVPSIAGSTGNLFPGSEITELKASDPPSGGELSVDLHPYARNRGEVFIRVPGPGRYGVNGTETESYEPLLGTWILRTGLYRVQDRRLDP
jgi:alpha-galactosidase